MNPGCDESISKLHIILFSMKKSGTCMKVYDDVQNEHGCKKVHTLDFKVQTHWNSAHSVEIHKITCE